MRLLSKMNMYVYKHRKTCSYPLSHTPPPSQALPGSYANDVSKSYNEDEYVHITLLIIRL